MLNLFSFHLISSHRRFSWKLLITSHCHRSLCHPTSSQFISSHVFSAFFTSSLLIPSHVFSPFLSSSQLITPVLSSSHVTWAFSSLLISSQLISAFLRFSQFFSTLLNSPQLMSAHLLSSHLSPFLTSSKLFSHLLSWSQLLSARLTSSQLFSAHSQIISALLRPATCSKNESRRQSKRPCAFYREDFAQRSLCTAFTHSKLLHTASLYTQQTFTERSFYTQIAWRSCVCQGIRGGCMKDLPGCSWELLAKGVVGRSCKVFNNSLWEDLCRDPGAVLEEVLAWSSTGPCEQILRRSCWKPPQAALGLCIGACMKVFLGCS